MQRVGMHSMNMPGMCNLNNFIKIKRCPLVKNLGTILLTRLFLKEKPIDQSHSYHCYSRETPL